MATVLRNSLADKKRQWQILWMCELHGTKEYVAIDGTGLDLSVSETITMYLGTVGLRGH